MSPQAGPASFEGYVREHGDQLVRVAWLITRNWEDARDAVQDALVGTYPRWAGLAAAGTLDGYCYRAAVNAALSILRRRKRLTPVAEPNPLPPPGEPDLATGVVESDAAWRLCGELPPIQRAAVVLRFYRDLSFAEIGAALGCPEATARSHVHRALAALRSRLSEGHTDG